MSDQKSTGTIERDLALSHTKLTEVDTVVKAKHVKGNIYVVEAQTTTITKFSTDEGPTTDVVTTEGLAPHAALEHFQKTGYLRMNPGYKSISGLGILMPHLREMYQTKGRYDANLEQSLNASTTPYQDFCNGLWDSSDLVMYDRDLHNMSTIYQLDGLPLPFPIYTKVPQGFDLAKHANLKGAGDRIKLDADGYVEYLPSLKEMGRIINFATKQLIETTTSGHTYSAADLERAMHALDILGFHAAGVIQSDHALYNDEWREVWVSSTSPSPTPSGP